MASTKVEKGREREKEPYRQNGRGGQGGDRQEGDEDWRPQDGRRGRHLGGVDGGEVGTLLLAVDAEMDTCESVGGVFINFLSTEYCRRRVARDVFSKAS